MRQWTAPTRKEWHQSDRGLAALAGGAGAAGAIVGLACNHPSMWPWAASATLVYAASVSASSPAGLRNSSLVLAVGMVSWQVAGQWWVVLAVSEDEAEAAAWRVLVLLLVVGVQVTWSVLAWVMLWPVAGWLKRSGVNASVVHPLVWVAASTAADSLRLVGWAGNGYAGLAVALVDAPGTAELLPLIGAQGLAFVWTASAAAISGLMLCRRPWRAAGAVVVAGATGALASASIERWTVPRLAPVAFVAIQPDIEKRAPWTGDLRNSLIDLLVRAIEAAPVDAVVVTSETFIQEAPPSAPAGRWEELLALVARQKVHVLLGMPQEARAGNARRLMNTVTHLAPDRQAVYAKERLVAGGEHLPWPEGLGFLYRRVFAHAGAGLLPASADLTGMLFAADTELGMSICHEQSFPATMVQRARGAAVLVNVADDSWIDSADYRAQMISTARVRAMEFEKPLLRVSNGGRSVLIDGRGRIEKAAAGRGREILRMSVLPRDGSTPYQRYAEFLAFAPVLLVVGCAWLVFASRRRAIE